MSNILPQEVRQGVWRMYRMRFYIAASLILLAVALLSVLALTPSYLAFLGDDTPAQKLPAGVSEQNDRNASAHAQVLFNVLSPLLSSTTTTGLIADAISERPATVAIYHITATAGHPGTVVLSGAAGSIEAVSQYQSALRADRHFSGVSIPVADLAGAADGRFSITLSADF